MVTSSQERGWTGGPQGGAFMVVGNIDGTSIYRLIDTIIRNASATRDPSITDRAAGGVMFGRMFAHIYLIRSTVDGATGISSAGGFFIDGWAHLHLIESTLTNLHSGQGSAVLIWNAHTTLNPVGCTRRRLRSPSFASCLGAD